MKNITIGDTNYTDVKKIKVKETETGNYAEFIDAALGAKIITSNGTYNASDEGLDGYSSVEVETSGVDINEYFKPTIKGEANSSITGWKLAMLKLPPFVLENTNASGIYRGFEGIEIDLSKLDISNVMNLGSIFENCKYVKELDLSNFKTHKATVASTMFSGCSALSEIDLSNFDTSPILYMSEIFKGCSKLERLILPPNFVRSSMTQIQGMFNGCSKLTSLDLRDWDTSGVSYLSNMFYGCTSLTELLINSWMTSNVTNMSYLVYNCKNLGNIDIKNWDVAKVTNINSAFLNCSSLTELDLSGWNTSSVTNMGATFMGCTSLQKLDIRNFDFTKVTTYMNIFGNGTNNYVPADCEIIVKDDTARDWILGKRSDFTNIKTVAEL